MSEITREIQADEEDVVRALSVGEPSLAVAIARAEIDQAIATARAFPRSVHKVIRNVLTLATLDEETAESCMYALPRGGKPIQGPSIRLAEIVASQWGNQRTGARVVHVDRAEKVIIAEGVFHDLETNSAVKSEVRRRVSDRHGRLLNDDMIVVTGNAACSIAKRNAILGGIPRGIWFPAYERCLQVVAGDAETLPVTRDKAIAALANFGLTADEVIQSLGLGGRDDITLNHVAVLRGIFSALKNGETTPEEVRASFRPEPAPKPQGNPLAAGRAPKSPGKAQDAPQADAGPSDGKPAEVAPASSEGETAADPAEKEAVADAPSLIEELKAAFDACRTPEDIVAVTMEFADRVNADKASRAEARRLQKEAEARVSAS